MTSDSTSDAAQSQHAFLDARSRALYALMGRSTRCPPLARDAKILEVGCGTGNVSVSLALRNPSAAVYALLSEDVLTLNTPPPNLRFMHGDIRSIAGSDEQLGKGSFDYVFSRLLIDSMSSWQEYIKTAFELLKPGGSLEVQELSWRLHSEGKGAVESATIDTLQKAASAQGYDLHCGEQIETWTKDAGFGDIDTQQFLWPAGDWAAERGQENTRAIGALWHGVRNAQLQSVDKICKERYSESEIAQLRQEYEEETSASDGLYMNFFVVTGKKPAVP